MSDPVRRVIDRRVPWAIHGEIFSHQSFGTGAALPQGWKLHVSATPFSAVEVLEAALDVLLIEGARFKVVKSTELLRSLNAGQFGLSQIGKFITVYPSDSADAVAVAVKLDELTKGRRGPRVPTDRPLRPGSLVHYRYGGMHQHLDWEAASEGTDGDYALRDAAGRLTNDIRAHYYLPPPPGIVDPFEAADAYVARPPRETPLNGRYLVVNALSHGLRGGVFRAIDLRAEPARLCLLKEAWHDVSLDPLGRDARDWLANEERILTRYDRDPFLPRFYDRFDLDDDRFIAIEYVEGTTLDRALSDRHSMMDGVSTSDIAAIGLATAEALAHLHEIGLIFRDFTPANVIETPDGAYRLIDFGIAYDAAADGGPPLGGGTPPFYSLEQFEGERPAPGDDVFAWGAVLHYLACGATSLAPMPKDGYGLRPFTRRPVAELRPIVPPSIAAVIDRAVAWERADRYVTMREARAAFAAAIQESKAAARSARTGALAAPSTEMPAPVPMDSVEALSLACQIGDALCAAAEERDGGLCWGARNEFSERLQYLPDLYSGAAGIGLFLAELARASGNDRYAEVARGAARWLVGPTWGSGRAQHGLHGGEPGVSYFFLRLAALLDEPGYVTAAELRIRRLQGAAFSTIDLIYGTAGTIVSLIRLHKVTGNSSYLAAARAAGDELVRRAVRAPRGGVGCYWEVAPAAPPGSSSPFLGLLHGAAGIALALAQLAAATGEERYLGVATDAAELLLAQARHSHADPSQNGSPKSEALCWPRQLGDDAPGLQAVCHGAGGIAQFFLRLNGFLPDRRYQEASKGAALTISAQRGREARSCLCHGLSGTGHILLDCYQAYGDPQSLDLARDCSVRLQRFRDLKQPGAYTMNSEGAVSPDLMLGYSGVGSFLLRLSDAEATPELILGECSELHNDKRKSE